MVGWSDGRMDGVRTTNASAVSIFSLLFSSRNRLETVSRLPLLLFTGLSGDEAQHQQQQQQQQEQRRGGREEREKRISRELVFSFRHSLRRA